MANPLFDKYRKAKPAVAPEAPASEPAPAPVEAEVIHEPTVEKPAPKAAPAPVPAQPKAAPQPAAVLALGDMFGLTVGEEGTNAMAAMAAMFEGAGAPRAEDPFPVVAQVRGNNGGMLNPVKGSGEADVLKHLRFGDSEFAAVYVGHRYTAAFWRERLGAGDDEEEAARIAAAASGAPVPADDKPKPLCDCIIAADDVANARLLSSAGKRYGQTKTIERGKFDGFGHMSPAVELLMWTSEAGLFVLKGVAHYKSTARTAGGILSAATEFCATQNRPASLNPFPGTWLPVSTDEQGRKPWRCHSVDCRFTVTPEIVALAKAYTAFSSEALADEGVVAVLKDWKKSRIRAQAVENMQRMLTA